MKKLLHYLTWSTAIIAICLFWMPRADAHPLGNFTINHYAGVQVAPDGVGIDYVLDMAEIPAFQEINHLDTNRDRKAEPIETVQYPNQKCQEVNSHLELLINKQPLALSLIKSTVEFPPGVGGLSTLRLSCNFQGTRELVGANQLIEFEDQFYPQRLGWREITVATNGVPIQGDFTSLSITNRLRDYPTELLSSPLDQRRIDFKLNPSLTSSEQASPPSVKSFSRLDNALTGRSNDVFTSLITQENHNFLTIVIALAIAFLWGGLHALSPGHGKTIVGAYLVGSRSNAQHALFLGLIMTITHTAGIFALGLVTLGTSQFILTEQLYPWLSVVSGVLVTVIGLNLFISRLQKTQVSHSHDHVHSHQHSHGLHHHHNHVHHEHSHLPDGDLTSMKWSSLLALGISGGLLPCPSALVVLLSAIAMGRVGFGLALVSAFSLGLAAVLTGIGLMLVYAKNRFEHLPLQIPRIKMLPVASALCITLIGLGITSQALLAHPWN
ncbi:high-affinity nickel-transporter [Nostoc sp. 'Peltigera membranacea cyanobiont' 210A]|uniref:nickel/cobalt transporter n=1 Tax=Nostoc sp. 'Peltigera membranacea cyanobiont' 210A TaxID=2014529 RepID=UPI000B95A926|nr:sulfite exporter TauE/SafE family protein [Nostoc sp. 'Peltigera membranacea cyanobiont' 210A]OYD89988.1 high-affinity nickel-transporter [Nostoc sp. 'Peltigera membranacea cyanobiont' 210A]